MKFAQGFMSPAEMAKAAFGFRQKLSNAVVVPKDGADADEVADFHKKLGVPADAKGYELEIPEAFQVQIKNDEAAQGRIEAFKERMHAKGAPPAVVQEAVNYYLEMGEQAVTDRIAALSKGREDKLNDLKKVWGADFQRNANFADRALKEVDDQDFQAWLETAEVDGVNIGDHPMIIEAFAKFGRVLMEDMPHMTATTEDLASAEKRIDEIMKLMHDDPVTYKSPAIQSELQKLYALIAPVEPIVGTDGRSS